MKNIINNIQKGKKQMSIFKKAKIMLPENADMTKWSVVACDQYTSERDYWERVKETVGDAPSTLNIIFPEVYLEDEGGEERIRTINSTMKKYVDEGVLKELSPCYIYTERTLKDGSVRKGIIGCADLEEYDFSKGSQSKIRATEGTVIERIPPRVKVRENASLELPHIMLLIDDEKKQVIENVAKKKDNFKKLYDFDLMENSGSIKGYLVDEDTAREFEDAFSNLGKKDVFQNKYHTDKGVLHIAVGDGNHSLATAKTCYENLKQKIGDKAKEMPQRYALCELGNLHDETLIFEAIHRVVFSASKDEFLKVLKDKYILKEGVDVDSFTIISDGVEESYVIENPDFNLTVGCIQSVIDTFIKDTGAVVDYIHGEDVVKKLSKDGNFGIILNCMKKTDLFPTVILDGALPRKTFSMGESHDKRFYLEARYIG